MNFLPKQYKCIVPISLCTLRNVVFLLNELLEKVVRGEKVNMEDGFPLIHAMKKNAKIAIR